MCAIAAPDEILPNDSSPAANQKKFSDTISACRARFAAVDAQIDAAGVRDKGYYRIPGYPYMRSDRLIASFGTEVRRMEALSDWLYQLRDNDGFSRDIELQNLGLELPERIALLSELRLCGVWLSNMELVEDADREHLATLTHIPAERPDGSVPVKPELKEAEKQHAAQVRASFSTPTTERNVPGTLVLWKVKPYDGSSIVPTDGFKQAFRDGMGRVGLTESQWELLAKRFAPNLLIETAGKLDKIGSPGMGDAGPYVDVSAPVVDFQADYARLGDHSLIQLNYFVWFPGRAASGADGADGGRIDGLIWRVTLDEVGKPLAYDTIHARGFDHLWFPLPNLKKRGDVPDDMVLIPQTPVPNDFVVRIGTGKHEVVRLVSASDVRASEVKEFGLRRYEKLLTLPLPGGGTRSLFGPDGTVAGTSAGSDVAVSASDVLKAGAIRQWGHHPVSLKGDVYFDDPHLLETRFQVVPAVESRQESSSNTPAKSGG